jgi:glycerol-3-phosphate dehydrogenase (NAD(P)+)
MKKIGYLGAGTWGIALASILASKGHRVIAWTREPGFAEELQRTRKHPKLLDFIIPEGIRFTDSLQEALEGAEILVESVTSSGIRPVFQEVFGAGVRDVPIVVTSKGIEQGTGLLLPEVISALLGEEESRWVGCLSGPSHAEEVIRNLPTSVVSSAYDLGLMRDIQELFNTPTFRVYPNSDIRGVCFGGALKNIIAIACGISDGLGYGDNSKAALMTRGLHEIKKMCVVKHCKAETLNGLSGLGDLCVTCMSIHSRNYRFGRLIAEGFSPEGARQKIGMAVEGIYSCVSARELSHKHGIAAPITEAIYAIIYEGLDPREAVKALFTRTIKEEHL